LLDFRVVADRAALAFDQVDQAGYHRTGAAHGEMHAPAPLQIRDQRVDGAGGKRVAADQQRMEAEDDPQAFVLDETADDGMDAAVSAQTQQVRRDPDHVGDGPEGDIAKFLEPDAASGLAQPHELLIAFDIAGGQTGDFPPHGVGVARAVECRSIVEADAIKRCDRGQRHIVRQFAAAKAPEFLQQEWSGQDGGAGIKGESVLTEHRRSATGGIELLHNGYTVAPRAQSNGCREAAKSRTDHHGVRAHAGRIWRQVDARGCQRVHAAECKR
jgi:hypothetical protein